MQYQCTRDHRLYSSEAQHGHTAFGVRGLGFASLHDGAAGGGVHNLDIASGPLHRQPAIGRDAH
jgi:hypothetical protein